MSRQYAIYLTGDKNTDRIVLDNITDDRELLEICKTNKTVYERVCDETFFRNRVMSKYPETVIYKDVIKTTRNWKNYFLNIVYYIDLLKIKYKFEYRAEGSPELEYLARKSIVGDYDKNLALELASKYGKLELVKYLVEHGADIKIHYSESLIQASKNGHLPVVEYLVKHGANITAHDNIALQLASARGHLPVVEYLVRHGGDVTANNYEPLKAAYRNKHFPVINYLIQNSEVANEALAYASDIADLFLIKYLVDHGADIHFNDDYVFRSAIRNGNVEIVDYIHSLKK